MFTRFLKFAPHTFLVGLLITLSGCQSTAGIICDYGRSWCNGYAYRSISPGGRIITQHEGIDFAGAAGDPVISASHGTVHTVQREGLCGGFVVVATPIRAPDRETGYVDQVFARYAHIVPNTDIKEGDIVEPGVSLGRIMSAYDAPNWNKCVGTHNHLHFAMHHTAFYSGMDLDPHDHWLGGPHDVTCWRSGLSVPEDKIVSPIPCG